MTGKKTKAGIKDPAEGIHEHMIILDRDLRVISVSRYFFESYNLKPEDPSGRLIYEIGGGKCDRPGLRELLKNTLADKMTLCDCRIESDFEGIGSRVMLLKAMRTESLPEKDRIILVDHRRRRWARAGAGDGENGVFKNKTQAISI